MLGYHERKTRKSDLELSEGRGFITFSPLVIRRRAGRIEVWGAERESLEVRERGIPILVRALEDSTLEVRATKPLRTTQAIVPKGWDDAAESTRNGEVVALLGGVDVGKSGLFAFLANKLCSRGYKVGVVDADVGQSDIGPVGTIGLCATSEVMIHPSLLSPDAMYFVGDSTPKGHLLPLVVGTAKLVELAKDMEADAVLVNTTGFIHSGAARALKQYKLAAIRPNKVILIQRGSEAEHITGLIPSNSELIRMRASRGVQKKGASLRMTARRRSITRYMAGASSIDVSTDEVRLLNTLFCSGEPRPGLKGAMSKALDSEVLYVEEAPDAIVCLVSGKLRTDLRARFELSGKPIKAAGCESYEGLYAGLLDESGLCMGIGLLEEFRPDKGVIRLTTNVREEFWGVSLGYLRFDGGGSQVGRRGSFEP